MSSLPTTSLLACLAGEDEQLSPFSKIKRVVLIDTDETDETDEEVCRLGVGLGRGEGRVGARVGAIVVL